MEQAVADGDLIYAVVKGIGHANAGGIESDPPNPIAYTPALNRAFQDANLRPSQIDYFETHGAGQPTTDDVESRALHMVFKGRNEPCAIGSIKPNIGHSGATAGLAALVKKIEDTLGHGDALDL